MSITSAYAQTDDYYLDSLNTASASKLHDTSRINAAIEKALVLELSDHSGAIKVANWALNRSKKIQYTKGIYSSYYALASTHYESHEPEIMHRYIDSMMQMKAPEISDEMRADAYNLLGIAHYSNDELIEAINAWENARVLMPIKLRSGVISNIGNIYLSSDEPEKAVGYFLEAADINEKEQNHSFLAINYLNIAACYDPGDTLVIHNLRKSELNGRKAGYLRILPYLYVRILRYYAGSYQFIQASSSLDTLRAYNTENEPGYTNEHYIPALAFYLYNLAKAKTEYPENSYTGVLHGDLSISQLQLKAAQIYEKMLSNSSDLRSMMYDHETLGELYSELGNFEAATKSYQLSLRYKDSLAVNKAKFILKDYERDQMAAEERERELKAENERQQQRFKFYGAISGAGILVILALGLISRLRYTRRSRTELQKEKDLSDELLLNILPEEVAEELKEKGKAETQFLDMVTVLFTDFKGFTAMAEQLSPQDLVNDLNTCFSEFDRIVNKYGIEKIKTIGDAYMAAGGLPTPNSTHASDVINAALEMRDFIEKGKAEKISQELPYFEIRIGVHTGPVVAGIVGVKKFQYDIWGDTVNTASRMESSGAIGKVNISEATYGLLKNDPELIFESRGKIQAKGKGEIAMWFVEPIQVSLPEGKAD